MNEIPHTLTEADFIAIDAKLDCIIKLLGAIVKERDLARCVNKANRLINKAYKRTQPVYDNGVGI